MLGDYHLLRLVAKGVGNRVMNPYQLWVDYQRRQALLAKVTRTLYEDLHEGRAFSDVYIEKKDLELMFNVNEKIAQFGIKVSVNKFTPHGKFFEYDLQNYVKK